MLRAIVRWLVSGARNRDGNNNRKRRATSRRVWLEQLEDRTAPAILTVTGTGDSIAADGFVTLREALTAANTNSASGDAAAGDAGLDTINFNIAGAPGSVHTIEPLAGLPTITDPVFINGYSQLGASANTLADGNNAFLAIELKGSSAGFHAGLTISAGNSTVQGLVINRFNNEGIFLHGNGGNVIRGNFIGTDQTGSLDRGNGVSGVGVLSSGNTIGGTAPADRNVISGNHFAGVVILGSGTIGNLVEGNFIGTAKNGTAALGNIGAGVRILNVTNNTVGGTAVGAGNRIAFNTGNGVEVSSAAGPSNAVLGNAIFSNGGLGIDLNIDGPTANDSQDSDGGPNGLQNFPVIVSAITSAVSTRIRGHLNSTPNAAFWIEFFHNDVADPSGYCEGHQFLGATAVTTDAQGNASFSFDTGFPVPTGKFVTATATDLDNNTSEFSTSVVTVNAVPLFVAGAGAGGGAHVKVFNGNGSLRFNLFPYSGFTGGVRVATGDVTGDGVDDIITGAGAGGGPNVKVFDGVSGNLIANFHAFSPGFIGGIHIGAGDINGDGRADVLVGAGAGGGPHVIAVNATQLANVQANGQIAAAALLRSFFAYGVGFKGGVTVAGGDVNCDGLDDIFTGAGAGGGPNVKVFDGLTNTTIANFHAFSPGFAGGVFVSASDIDGDGRVDVLVSAGAGGGPQVIAVDATQLSNVQANGQIAAAALLRNFFAYGAGFRGGVSVAGGDINGDGLGDIVTGAGPGGGPNVRVFNGVANALLFNFNAFDIGFAGGVFAG